MKSSFNTAPTAFKLLGGLCCLALMGADWSQFRGVAGNPIAAKADLPTTWSDESNTAWVANLPGRGVSSPIVVGDRVFITSSSGVKQNRLHVACYSVDQGKQLWHREFWATGRTLCHPTSANAAPTPASDGKFIYAFYSSNDLICLDLDGNLQWFRGLAHDYPKAGNDVGMSSSPAVVNETVIVQIECQGDSFAAGIDTANGETRWRIKRSQMANWTSPTVLPATVARPSAILLQSPGGLTAHDPRTGRQLWDFDENCSGVVSPLVAGKQVFVAANGITALQISENGEHAEIQWDSNQLNPSSASPLVHDGRVYSLNRGSILTCGDATDGSKLWQLRVPGSHWATPVLAANRIYCLNDAGKATVVELGDKPKIVGEADFAEPVHGSPAVAGNALYVRTNTRLWKISAR